MTKKDYVVIAAALCAVREQELSTREECDAQQKCANSIARALANDNSRFDRDRFLSACGIPGHDAPRRTRGGAR